MIITCKECSTSFNLDETLIKEDGSKVRCSICKSVFTAYPDVKTLEQQPETASDLHLESETDAFQAFEDSQEFEMDDPGFTLSDSDLEIDGPDLEAPDDLTFDENDLEMDVETSEELDLADSSFEFEEAEIQFEEDSEETFDSIEFEPMEDTSSLFEMEADNDGLTLETDSEETEDLQEIPLEDDDEFELEFDIEDTDEHVSQASLEDESQELSFELESEPDKEESPLSVEENLTDVPEEEPEMITPEDDFSEYDEVLAQETEPEEESIEQESIDVEDSPADEDILAVEKPDPLIEEDFKPKRRKKRASVGAPVLVLLVIFLLIAGAYIASIMTGYKIPYLSDIKLPYIETLLNKPVPETVELKPIPNQKSVNGRFVTNTSAGTLFVITGSVENPSEAAYNYIEVRGELITKDKVSAKTKNAFCGNIITEEMLKTGNISDINKLLNVKEGAHNSNVNVKPGTNIPFMVVFSDLPDNLQNFTVKVSRSEKVDEG